MKKVLNIFIVLLFLCSTTGFTMTRHFCKGNLVSVSINKQPKPCCETKGCCHNESEFFKLKEKFSPVHFSIVDFDYIIDVNLFINESFELATNNYITSIYFSKGFIPPPELGSALADLQFFRL